MVRRRKRTIRTLKRQNVRRRSPRKELTLKGCLLNVAIGFLIVAILVLASSRFIDKFWQRSSPPEKEIPKIPPKEKIVRVEVLNGCGVTGLARKFTDYLRSLKFDVVNVGDYKNWEMNNTLVIDRSSMDMENASKVAQALGVSSYYVQPLINKDLLLDVTVIVGRDYKKLKGYQKMIAKQ